ncbi:hypothetical protein GE300_13110 [Rhodobacteraceae bacterium 2CG4]|uniref:DUF4177 domain-containing protein n=1 Tax=Halovulum marinum TaxID=2662447 RepID=A0A6L5Z3I7_9RHOB|nr:hypothetical protein [Halovulum marinum]MSU90544.1 hypothetical protein [Halovulum marinum]
MQHFEYKVVAAPRRAKRAKGAKTPAERFAFMLSEVMNAEARDGWEYLRADTLPAEEKKGMLSNPTEVYQTVLVFRRPVSSVVSEPAVARRNAARAVEAEAPTEDEVEDTPRPNPKEPKEPKEPRFSRTGRAATEPPLSAMRLTPGERED